MKRHAAHGKGQKPEGVEASKAIYTSEQASNMDYDDDCVIQCYLLVRARLKSASLGKGKNSLHIAIRTN